MVLLVLKSFLPPELPLTKRKAYHISTTADPSDVQLATVQETVCVWAGFKTEFSLCLCLFCDVQSAFQDQPV